MLVKLCRSILLFPLHINTSMPSVELLKLMTGMWLFYLFALLTGTTVNVSSG